MNKNKSYLTEAKKQSGEINLRLIITVVAILGVLLIATLIIVLKNNKKNESSQDPNSVTGTMQNEENTENQEEQEYVESEEDIKKDEALAEQLKQQNADPLFNGKWVFFENGEAQEGNYFQFNPDGTFIFSIQVSDKSVIQKGTYTYGNGAKIATQENPEGEIKETINGWLLYNLLISSNTVTLSDGTEQQDEELNVEYIFAVNMENTNEMAYENLSSEVTGELRKVE